jgi:transcriptional regulator GlxA family with amidase domain
MPPKTVAIVTFDRFNELDSLIALHLFGRVREHGIAAEIVAPAETVTSMNGIRITGARPLEWATEADVVLFGSGRGNRQAVADPAIMGRLRVDPARQLVGSQCSGALALHQLGIVGERPFCTDVVTRKIFDGLGVKVANRAFAVDGNVATAGGCLSAQYLAAWVITRTLGWERASEAILYVAPVGEEEETVERVRAALEASGRRDGQTA